MIMKQVRALRAEGAALRGPVTKRKCATVGGLGFSSFENCSLGRFFYRRKGSDETQQFSPRRAHLRTLKFIDLTTFSRPF